MPITGITTAKSDKESKQAANRKLRRLRKQKIHQKAEILPVLKEVSDAWNFRKDGKRYHRTASELIFRK